MQEISGVKYEEVEENKEAGEYKVNNRRLT